MGDKARLISVDRKSRPLVYVSVNSDAIDASFGTKRDGLHRIARDAEFKIEDVAVIGDSANDLPFLLEPNVRLAAVPANGQTRVKNTIGSLEHGVVLEREGLEGFMHFYEMCRELKIRLIVTDRDGVLRWKNDGPFLGKFREIYKTMGIKDNPIVVVLTGSSAEQNYRFVAETSIAKYLAMNPKKSMLPMLIYAENGNVVVDIESQSSSVSDKSISKNDIDTLLGSVKDYLIEEISTNILPKTGLTISTDPEDQTMKVYLPLKSTMLTVNVPKKFANGEFYRDSAEAERFRRLVDLAMGKALQKNNFEIVHL